MITDLKILAVRTGAGALALATLSLAPAPAAAAEPELVPCFHPAPAGALCGALTVPENRTVPDGRTLSLKVMVLPATGEAGAAAPLFYLVGGPGQGAASIAMPLAARLEGLRPGRDVVLVDQRGTGGSGALACPAPEEPAGFFGHVFDPEIVARCRDELAARADLTAYTTPAAADDLDAVRQWLGYEQVDLWGTSYGTRLAMVYLRRHPERVRSMILEGVSALDHHSPLSYALDAQRAVDRLLSACEADAACGERFPDARHQLRVLVDRLRRGPVELTIEAADGSEAQVRFSLGDFGYAVRGMLYGPLALRLPALLHRAVTEDDLTPFAQFYYQRAFGLSQGIADGLYLSVMCSEDVPFFGDEEARRATEGTFLGDFLIRDYRRACAAWSRGELPPGYHEPVRSDVPALLLSGGRDPVTPPRWGEAVAEHLSASRHLVVESAGHGVARAGECPRELIRRFLERGSADDLDLSCAAAMEPPPFVLELDPPPGAAD